MECLVIIDYSWRFLVEGKSEKECLKEALRCFNEDQHTGAETLEEDLEFSPSEYIGDRQRNLDRDYSLKHDYPWEDVQLIRAKSNKLKINNATDDMTSILNELEEQFMSSKKQSAKDQRHAQYVELQKEFK